MRGGASRTTEWPLCRRLWTSAPHGAPPRWDPHSLPWRWLLLMADDQTRKFALQSLAAVATIGSHLQMFVDYVGTMRGWGRWATECHRGVVLLPGISRRPVYQVVKYRQRYNWTHRDLLRKSHPKNPDSLGLWNELFAWITHGTIPEDTETLGLIHAYEEAKTTDVPRLLQLIGHAPPVLGDGPH